MAPPRKYAKPWPGVVYRNWTVLGWFEVQRKWVCQCVCGHIQFICGRLLCDGTRGALCKKCKIGAEDRYSGDMSLRITGAVSAAIARCINESHQLYEYYGKRGIRVCDAWLMDPPLFAKYLLSLPGCDDPRRKLDRINNDGHYEPGNLRFATASESARNRRKPMKDGSKT